jgi:hypothetical protein
MMVTGCAPLWRLLPVLMLAAATACTSQGRRADAAAEAGIDADQVVITVHNNRRPFREVTVLVFPRTAVSEQTLGTVPPGETRSFAYRGSAGSHYLLARRPNWSPVARSRSFTMPERGHVEWSTRLPRARVHSR